VIALVANKSDLVKNDEKARQVQESETKKFAADNNLLYIGESSALEDINIKEVVNGLLEKIHEVQ